jgi:NADH:ubiquinone oxidoreductase subunit 5 (subunit L)/multisubunit Na+/H+ antiporter MnhA subunit
LPQPPAVPPVLHEVPISILASVPVAPALVALLVALRIVRGERAVAGCVAGSAAVALALSLIALGSGAQHLAVLVASAVALIALIVSSFAARSMQGGSVPYAPFLALLAAATAGSLTIAVASDLRVLAAAWIATGLFASGLVGAARGRAAARRVALRHLAIERVGDLAWLIVLVTTWQCYHTFDLPTLARLATPNEATTLIAVALVIAGITRSAIVPFHAWLPNSMEAPTTVSAFMHAGIVNGAGVLLAKTAPIIVAAPAALIIAAFLGGVTAVLGATIATVRPETKRRLGWSTVAQMGFMVLQCGCGAFAAAVVHLVAHGGYKSVAFLGAAGRIDQYTRIRLAVDSSPLQMHAAVRAGAALAPPTVGVALAAILMRGRLVELPAAAMIVAIAWATGASAARRCAASASAAGELVGGMAVVVAAVASYLVCVTEIDAWLGAVLPHVTFEPVTSIVAALVLAGGLLEALGIRPPAPDLLYTLALTEGRATRMEAA